MNNNILDFRALKLTLASPEKIKEWSHGEILKPETINYRTLKPEKDGLFDERIFGPTKDFECYCGKYKRVRYKGVICDKCGVEVTYSRVRRERMGHINLAAPIAHNWFFRGSPSKIGLILDISPRNLEMVIYFASYLVISVSEEARQKFLTEALARREEMVREQEKKEKEEITLLEKEFKTDLAKTKKEIRIGELLELKVSESELKKRQRVTQIKQDSAKVLSQLEQDFQTLSTVLASIAPRTLISEEEYQKLSALGADEAIRVGMGAEAIFEVLENLNLDELSGQLRDEVAKTTGQKHVRATKKLRLVEGMRKAGIKPSWMIVKILPVIPPDLRPMVQLSGGRFATSDLNDLYRRVLNRNNRLKKLIDLGAPEIILRNEKRMLQEAVDSLIDSSARPGVRAISDLRSLSDMLKGKQGRFRQNLLGKRVDYSGRSVIVVGPDLSLNQTGLPKEMALEMFKPFILRELITRGYAPNPKAAKNVLERRRSEVWDILDEITRNHPVILNRAPTLHRLGIQAFYPILIDGNAIKLHPCVCAGFNADFDGDQMAVHIPLSEKAIEETRELLISSRNLLRPADGSPVTVPNLDMAMGCYWLTTINEQIATREVNFENLDEVLTAFQNQKISLRQIIKVKKDGKIIETTAGRIIFNERMPEELRFINYAVSASKLKALVARSLKIFPQEKMAELIDVLKELGFHFATRSGLSLSIWDCKIAPRKQEILDEAEKRVAETEKTSQNGLITREEQKRLVSEIWMETTDKLAELTWKGFEPEDALKLWVDSGGAKASPDQIKQVCGMRGLVADPTGKIVELPTKSNYREGLSVFEYFTSARGSRKGLADKALKTAEAGYLTRRLVDVAHDMIVRVEDCQTEEGVEILRDNNRQASFIDRVLGRILAQPVKSKTGKILLRAGTDISEENISVLESEKIEKVVVRSPLTCQTKVGICATCYGRDLGIGKKVEVGTPVGVIAAQSIGEPGTQLTMRTFHLGGIVGLDITQGLPRVEELLEARIPKVLAPISEISGKVSIDETDFGYKVRVKSIGFKPALEREYIVPANVELKVEDGQKISAGTSLAAGHLDVKKVLEISGLRASQKYVIKEVQDVYESQGVSINDKHFEVIVRKMCDKVRIETYGDTVFLPGELVDKVRFEGENAKILAEGGEPATAQIVILGITRSALLTESFLSAASFQETTNILAEAAITGKEDKLSGLKENVIIGRLIPTSPDRARIG